MQHFLGVHEDSMKKKTDLTNEFRQEYDFARMKGGVRGKYIINKRFREGANTVLLELKLQRLSHKASRVTLRKNIWSVTRRFYRAFRRWRLGLAGFTLASRGSLCTDFLPYVRSISDRSRRLALV
jgi:hypothetical protein